MIKLGTYAIGGSDLHPSEKLRIIKSAGFDLICLSYWTLANPEASKISPELCAKLGLEVDHLHLTGNGTHHLWEQGEQGDAIAERFCAEIVGCREMGVKTGVLHAIYGKRPETPAGSVGLARFEQIVECAEKNGVLLALENSVHDDYLDFLFENIKSPNLLFCYDTGHHNAFAHDRDFLGSYGARLGATHLHDNDGTKDQHMIPFSGSFDWEQAARGMAKCANTCERICSEIACDAYLDLPYEQTYAMLFEAMSRLAGMIEAARADA